MIWTFSTARGASAVAVAGLLDPVALHVGPPPALRLAVEGVY